MTDTTKAQILDLARKAINTELLALKRMKETLGDNFADAVEMILSGQGKCIVTGMGKSGLVGRKIAATLVIDARSKRPGEGGNPARFPNVVTASEATVGLVDRRWTEYRLGAFVESPSRRYRRLLLSGGAQW